MNPMKKNKLEEKHKEIEEASAGIKDLSRSQEDIDPDNVGDVRDGSHLISETFELDDRKRHTARKVKTPQVRQRHRNRAVVKVVKKAPAQRKKRVVVLKRAPAVKAESTRSTRKTDVKRSDNIKRPFRAPARTTQPVKAGSDTVIDDELSDDELARADALMAGAEYVRCPYCGGLKKRGNRCPRCGRK